jgi:circadian clock protein KaiC
MTKAAREEGIQKLATGIQGFDLISMGGLPKGRTTLLTGTAGSAKTVIAAQFLAEGLRQAGENGVFVTFEESPHDIRRNMAGLGWDIQQWESEGRWVFVDATQDPEHEEIIAGSYDFGALLSRIEHAIATSGARRVVMDSLGAVFTQYHDGSIVRRELFRLASALKRIGVTALLTSERTQEYGEISRYGVEEFVADNVIILRNALEAEKRRRTIEILKYRGTLHQKGEYPFTIVPGKGAVVIPLSAMELKQKSSNLRITSGNAELDQMCGGGFFRDSIVLVSGATGTGKTLMASQFLHAGTLNNERCLFFGFEESREQLFRNAAGWGIDFHQMEEKGLIKVVADYPEVMGLEDHLLRMKRHLDDFQPDRVVVDSLSALERVATIKGFREFIVGLTSFIKHQEVAGFFTSTTPTLMGGTSITEAHISTITDSIILLRYVELFGEMRRSLTVLKMRGSRHEKDIREFSIDDRGMHIGKPFRGVSGILAGYPACSSSQEAERMGLISVTAPPDL